jgi:hypothetical protein
MIKFIDAFSVILADSIKIFGMILTSFQSFFWLIFAQQLLFLRYLNMIAK